MRRSGQKMPFYGLFSVLFLLLLAFSSLPAQGLLGDKPKQPPAAQTEPAAPNAGSVPGMESSIGFYGKVERIDLQTDVVIVRGYPMDQVRKGQAFDVVLGQEVWAKIKVFFVGDDTFEATVIEGSIVALARVLDGRAETLSGFRTFRVLDVDRPQQIACKMKDFSVRRYTTYGQNANGFLIKDENNGQLEVLPYHAIEMVVYRGEPLYKQMKEMAPEDDPRLPGYLKQQQEQKELARKNQKYKLLMLQSDRYLRAGRFKEVAALSEEARGLFSDRYDSYYYSAEASYGLKKYRYAAAFYDHALKLKPDAPEKARMQLNMAYSFYHMNHLSGAEYYLKRAIKNGQDNFKSTSLMARISFKLGKFNNALDYAEQASKQPAESDAEKADMKFFVSRLYYNNQGDTDQALKHISEAKKLDPKSEPIAAFHKKLMLERMKEATATVQYERLGGTWKSPDSRLFMHFFEESAFILFITPDKKGSGARVIMVGGDMSIESNGQVIISEVKNQRLQLKSFVNIKRSQVMALNEHMFSGSDEFEEMDDIIFKIKRYDIAHFELVLDGKHWKLTPLQ